MEDRRVRRTKKQIRDALTVLMAKKNIADITVTELTREADIDRRTFYLHYNNIYEIVEEVEQEAVANLRESIEGAKRGEDLFKAFTAIMEANIKYYDTIIKDRSYYVLEHDCKEFLKQALTAQFRPVSKLDDNTFDFYLEYVASGIINMYTHWIREEKPFPAEQLTEMVRKATVESWQKLSEQS